MNRILKSGIDFLAKTKTQVYLNSIRYTSSSQPFDYLRTNLHNGVGRYVCQMARVTFSFCKEQPNSIGMREFIEVDLIDFARKHPGIVVYLKPRRHRRPRIVAEYLNGQAQSVDVHQYTREQIAKWLEFMRTRSGCLIVRLIKNQHTDNPSIQGVWDPFLNKTPKTAITQFPSSEYQKSPESIPTATEKILEIYSKQNRIDELSTVKNIVKST